MRYLHFPDIQGQAKLWYEALETTLPLDESR
jgi:hypothetical protein